MMTTPSTRYVLILCLLFCGACHPSTEAPTEELLIVPGVDMTPDMKGFDMPAARDQQMPADMRDVVVDIALEMVDITVMDRGASMPDAAPDAPEEMVSFESLGQKSVREIFPWAQPGQSSPDTPLDMYYSAALDVYVGVDGATGWDVSHVRATFEALHMLRDALPEAYIPLFERARTGDTSSLPYPQQAPWTNQNEAAAFVLLSDTFQGSGAVMASNFYALGPQDGGTYRNMPFLNIRPEVIEGRFETAGPQLVYPELTRTQARDMYLREGLADSLLHERIHAHISQFYAHDVRFEALRGQLTGCEYDLEELLVKHTLEVIYEDHPELFSESHRTYWRRDRELLEARYASRPCYADYDARGWLDAPLFLRD